MNYQKFSTLLFFSLLGIFSTVLAQTVVEEKASVLITPDKTLEELKQQAVQEALAEAVRRVVGVQVQASDVLTRVESRRELEERFSQIVRLDATGRVIDYKILEEDFLPKEGGQIYYYVKLQATVVEEKGQPDPGFQVFLDLNDQLYFDRGRLENNDEIILTVRTTRDAYLTIFIISGDSVQVVFPNRFMPDNFLPANMPFEFPSLEWRERGLHLRVFLPRGRKRAFELISVVATREQLPFSFPHPSDEQAIFQATLKDLNKWLVSIPLNQRAIADAAYEIRRWE